MQPVLHFFIAQRLYNGRSSKNQTIRPEAGWASYRISDGTHQHAVLRSHI